MSKGVEGVGRPGRATSSCPGHRWAIPWEGLGRGVNPDYEPCGWKRPGGKERKAETRHGWREQTPSSNQMGIRKCGAGGGHLEAI